MTGTVEVLVAGPARCGESPVWDPTGSRLAWVDILSARVHLTDLGSGVTTTVDVPTPTVGAVAPSRDGGLVLAAGRGFGWWDPMTGYRTGPVVLPEGQRMNDAAVDPGGRLWAGSVDEDFAVGAGRLWVLDPDGTTRTVVSGLTAPNGLGWSPDHRTFYLVDSVARLVLVADWDGARPGPLTVLADLGDLPGLPDGMCVDLAGTLWIAMYGGGQLARVSSGGVLLAPVPVPVRQPTACAFVGADHGQLVVTSAAEGLDRIPGTPDGALLTIPGPGTTGTPGSIFG